jgi:hypothetical protein
MFGRVFHVMLTHRPQRFLWRRRLLLAVWLAMPLGASCQLTSADEVVRPPAPRGSGGAFGRDTGLADEPTQDVQSAQGFQDAPYGTTIDDADSVDGAPIDSPSVSAIDVILIDVESSGSGEVGFAEVRSIGSNDAGSVDAGSIDADSIDVSH